MASVNAEGFYSVVARPSWAPAGPAVWTRLGGFIHTYRDLDLASLGKETIRGSFTLSCPWRAAPDERIMVLVILLLAAWVNRRRGDRPAVGPDRNQCNLLLSNIEDRWSPIASVSLLGLL